MRIPLHHVAFGAGTPLLALHGWSPDHRLMTGCLEPVFASRPAYRRIYPDLPGMGRTPAPESVASSDDILDALLTFVDEQLGAEPFLLVGESYGGYLARAIAGARPGQVAGLALICPIGTALEPAARTLPEHTVLHAEPGLVDALSADEAADYTEITVVQTPETLRRFLADVAPGLAAADPAALARIRARWRLSREPEAGPAYQRPTLIVTGRQDSAVGYADQYALLPHYPRASYVVLDRAGHNLQFEQPALFEALLSEWLDRVAEDAQRPA
jgi:pimeloyl-ACP methyl ester carboxylesterase